MSQIGKILGNRSITSKLEVERKFVPSPLLQKYASETWKTPRISLISNRHPSATLTRLPRKRVTDKYFDHKGQLEQKGIWVRWRKEQITTHDGVDIITSHDFWEAKVKQGGDFLDSQFVEAKGRDAVENLMIKAGVCRSIYELSFHLGSVADRVSWAVDGLDGYVDEEGSDHTANMTLVLDTMSTALEGRDGKYPKAMHHTVGELELEKTITTNLLDEDHARFDRDTENMSNHDAVCASQAEVMREQLSTFMAAYQSVFDTSGSPVGKITAYMQQKEALATRSKKAHAMSRLANMSEARYERLLKDLKTESEWWGHLHHQ